MSEFEKPHRFYNLADLETGQVPQFRAGDTVIFDSKRVDSLTRLARCVEVDLLAERDAEHVPYIQRRLILDGIEYESLSEDEKIDLLPAPFSHLKTDDDLILKRVLGKFKTGIDLISAELIAKKTIPLVASTTKDYYGWLIEINAALQLPGMLQQEDGMFRFLVAHDGKMLRYGPYDEQKQAISNVKSKTMVEALATARSMAGIALGGGGSTGRTTINRGTLQG